MTKNSVYIDCKHKSCYIYYVIRAWICLEGGLDSLFYPPRRVDIFLAKQEMQDPTVEPFRQTKEAKEKREKALIAIAKTNKKLLL